MIGRALHTAVVFHDGGVTGPALSLEPRLRWLADRGSLRAIFPGPGDATDLYGRFAEVQTLRYAPLTLVSGPRAALVAGAELARDVMRFRSIFAETRPDVVIVVTSFLPAALVAARLAGARCIVYAAEVFEKGYERRWLRSLGSDATVRLTGSLAHHVVTCSKTVAAQYAGLRALVTTIYPGIAADYADGNRTRLRNELGWPESDPCVAVVGNLNEGRAQDLALQAMPLIRKHFLDARCLVAGAPLPNEKDAAYHNRLVALVEELDLRESVGFLGFVEHVADVYAAADIVVNPARFNEPFGRVALEALVAGRPVVAARVGAIPEVLRDGRDALLVEPENPEAIASAVVRLLSDHSLARRLVAAGSERVLTEFGEARGVEAFADVVERVLPAD